MKTVTLLVAFLIIISIIATSCTASKYGCPATHSQGRVKGAFKA